MRVMLVPALLLALPLAAAWAGEPDRPHHADFAELAAEGLPPEERAFLETHREAFRRGALHPDAGMNPWYHTYTPSDGKGGALKAIEESERRIRNLHANGTMNETLAVELGILTHWFMDLSQPLHTGAGSIDNHHHAEVEDAAFYHERDLALGAFPPQETRDLVSLAETLAWESANMSDDYERALNASGPWSLEIQSLSKAAASLGVQATATALHYAMRDAAWGEAPPMDAEPTPEGPAAGESVGARHAVPGWGAAYVSAGAAFALLARRLTRGS